MNVAEQVAAAMFAENPDGEQQCELNLDGSVQIVRLFSGDEGSGVGTRAMRAATAIADQLGVALKLSPDGSYFEDEAAAETRLREWYARFGFKPLGIYEMLRKTPA